MLHETPAEIAIYDNYDTSDDDYDTDQNICCKIYLQKQQVCDNYDNSDDNHDID